MPKAQTILVVGGGVAGLTIALCLAKSGHTVQVFEKAKEFAEVGAGLQLSPNALRILYDLGLERRIRAIAHAPEGIRINDGKTGSKLGQVPLGATSVARYGLPYLVLHRADLIQILAGACADHPAITLHTNAKVIDAAPHANGVTLEVLKDPSPEQHAGRFVVAADGVWSSFRQAFLKNSPAKFSGEVAWRALLPADQVHRDMLEETNLYLGSKAHMVTYSVKARRYLNVVVAEKTREIDKDWAVAGDINSLRDRLSGWSDACLSLLSPEAQWTKWPLFTASINQPWHGHGVVLIGDAAHAMLPYAAQGAAQAIEDAAVLALMLERFEGDDAKALASYEAARKARVVRVLKLVESNRFAYHMAPPLSLARNLVIKSKKPEALLARQDWLYGWRVSDS